MHACLRRGVDFLLAGSIRDDGPLPEVVTDVLQAQLLMAEKVQGCEMALMIATMLHSVATGNLLPATCRTVCVDINPAVVTKLADRGTHQAVGLVTDVEPFFAELLGYWLNAYGRNVPMPVKRGVADAVRRLYTERTALRYDGLSRQIRMADVIRRSLLK